MGWLWSSSDDSQVENPHDTTTTQHGDSHTSSTAHPTPPPKPGNQLDLLAYFNPPQNPPAAVPHRLETAKRDDNDDDDDYDDDDDDEDDDDDDPSSSPNPNPNPNPKPLLTPSHLYPSVTYCHQHFDQAFHCQSPRGQFLNVYRYGQLRHCSQHWSNFWWCVRTNRSGMGKEEKEERVRKRYWEQDQRMRARREGCSEDVWRQRRYRIDEGVFVTGVVPEYPGVGEGEISRTH